MDFKSSAVYLVPTKYKYMSIMAEQNRIENDDITER